MRWKPHGYSCSSTSKKGNKPMNARSETTAKAAVRSDAKGRILSVTARLEAMRLLIKINAVNDQYTVVDAAEQQVQVLRMIAYHQRSTQAVLRDAAACAERIADAALVSIKAACKASALSARAVRGMPIAFSKVVYGAGERVAVLMVTYPEYRYDVVVNGEVVYSIPATRAWRTERRTA